MIVVETILGALTGYFTNDIAIRHLFKKNGVVSKEREQFTKLIVEVLKEQILSQELLNELRDKPQMRAFFNSLVRDVVLVEVPELLSDASLADLDENGTLRALFHEHLNHGEIGKLRLHADVLAEAIGDVLACDGFAGAWQQAGENLARMTLGEAGLHDWFLPLYKAFHGLDNDQWQSFLSETARAICTDLEIWWEKQTQDKTGCLADYIPIDGEMVMSAAEGLIFSDSGKRSMEKWRTILQSHDFQAHVYEFGERMLPEIIGLLLEPAMALFFPLLHEEKHWFEAAVIDSITLGGRETGRRHQTALAAIQAFFLMEKDGRDWMEQVYDHYREPAYARRLCLRVSHMFLNEIMASIDDWRSATDSDDESIMRLAARYESLRTFFIQLINHVLSHPMYGNEKFHKWMQRLIVQFSNMIGSAMTASQCMDYLRDWLEPLCNRNLEQIGLSNARWEAFLQRINHWWLVNGRAVTEKLLARFDDDKDVEKLIAKAFDRAFTVPLSCVLAKGGKQVPLDRVADGIREQFFDLLPDYLGKLTYERLDSMDEEEIRQLVLSIIGKEMKPLSWLGGAVGLIVGCLTGTVMSVSGIEATPENIENTALVVAARSGMYGAVGYGTNVMAVKGLFWPYKKVLCFQGLISANQERFAETMKHLTHDYVINDVIWQEQVNHLQQLYDENHDDWLVRALHLLDERREATLKPYYEDLLRIVLSESIINTVNGKSCSQFAQSLLSPDHHFLEELALANEYVLPRIIYRKTIDAIIAAESDKKIFSHRLTKKFYDATALEWMHLLMDVADGVHFPSDEPIYERILLRLSAHGEPVSSFLLRHQESVTDFLELGLLRRLPFALQMGYKLVGGHEVLDEAVAYFLEMHFPVMLHDRATDLHDVVLSFFMKTFAGKSLAEVGILPSLAEGQWIAEGCKAMDKEQVHEMLMNLLSVICSVSDDTFAIITANLLPDALQTACSFAEHLRLQLDSLWQDRVRWDDILCRMEPVVKSFAGKISLTISPDELFVGGSSALWQAFNAFLTFNDTEKKKIIEKIHFLISLIAPTALIEAVTKGRMLIGLLDLPQLTQERVLTLSPEMLEHLIRSIAQPYFNRVEAMGALGAAVALPATYFSLALN